MDLWLKGLAQRANFYIRGTSRPRRDGDFNWNWFLKRRTAHLIDTRRLIKSWLRPLGGLWAQGISGEWLQDNAKLLWETRQVLADDLSRRLFDDALILKIVGYRRFYLPPEEFSDLFGVLQEGPFSAVNLPSTYSGALLKDLQLVVRGNPVRVVMSETGVEGINGYRQYFVRRGGVDFSPALGEVILDCGACIGDVGMLFAAMVGPTGQVHMFDPMPPHVRFCNYQIQRNPQLKDVAHVVPLAVGARTDFEGKDTIDVGHIDPAARATPDMPFTTIDDYVERVGLKVDYIKMDIEGGEIPALEGARNTIARQRPRLAISAYHKDDDLWTIRQKILELNPNYKLHFGHHTPVQWESVIYAVDQTEPV